VKAKRERNGACKPWVGRNLRREVDPRRCRKKKKKKGCAKGTRPLIFFGNEKRRERGEGREKFGRQR